MKTAVKVSEAFLSISKPECGDVITNLKLQKLLYYIQGFHLAIENKRLFNEDIYAWQYGPVVPDIYHKYKDNGAEVITAITAFDFKKEKFTKFQIELIEEVYSVYGQFSALKLMNMTHEEAPWKTTKIGELITDKKLTSFFKTLVIQDAQK